MCVCVCVCVCVCANLCRGLYLSYSLLQERLVEVSEHLTCRQRPLQGVEVPLDDRQTALTALLLVKKVLRGKIKTCGCNIKNMYSN